MAMQSSDLAKPSSMGRQNWFLHGSSRAMNSRQTELDFGLHHFQIPPWCDQEIGQKKEVKKVNVG
jgi:hypothetical protein